MAMTARLWSISAAAVELGRDRRTVASALAKVAADGQEGKNNAWYLRTIINALSGNRGDGEVLDYEAERARKTKEEADAQEMKNALMRRELLRREDVDAAVTAAFARVRARMLAVPPKVAPQVVTDGEPAIAERTVRAAINEALLELSETTVADLCGDSDALVADASTAAGPDNQPVGGSGTAA